MSSYPITCYVDMQRAVPVDSGAGTSSYRVLPSNTAAKNFSIFRDRSWAELIYFPISSAMFSMMFHRLMWTHFVYHTLDIRFYLSPSVNQTSHFSNFADFRQLQIKNAQTKNYEMLPVYTKLPHNAPRKIWNRYNELKYHFLTLQKKSDYFWTRVYNVFTSISFWYCSLHKQHMYCEIKCCNAELELDLMHKPSSIKIR